MLDSVFSVDEDNNNLVQRRRNGSPYVDPNDLFSIPEVKEEVQSMKPALDSLESSGDEDKAEN